MHLEVKVALNFIVSYLYNKLPRRRADLFGEELERILVSRFEGHWYPEVPLRGSAFRCLNLGGHRDPVVELAAKRSGLDTEEVHANVPPELSIWIDPYEVSYQIGEKGAVNVLYMQDSPGLRDDGERSDDADAPNKGDIEFEELKSLGFNPEAQVFVPIGGQASPVLLPPHSSSPTPISTSSCQGLFGYAAPSTPTNLSAHSSNPSTPSPPNAALVYPHPAAPPSSCPAQVLTFTTASFAATKFGSTKMKKNNCGSSVGSGVVVTPQQRLVTHSPNTISPPGLVKHKPLSIAVHSLVNPIPSQLSPNAKEFVFPPSQRPLYFDAEVMPMTPLQALPTHASFDPFSSPPPGQAVRIIGGTSGISFMDKPPFVEGLGGYNLQYSGQAFQPVVLAN
ncbi:protein Tob2-like [Xyrauchen texanus]|uniref:protein Tob2-like n=1 Tax=Xyrauchen texanus TaxID=154827 RepID=UPI0022419041|nr:protein Tob2-like [Xyrauchen texanus]